jgi:hypothetical protein
MSQSDQMINVISNMYDVSAYGEAPKLRNFLPTNFENYIKAIERMATQLKCLGHIQLASHGRPAPTIEDLAEAMIKRFDDSFDRKELSQLPDKLDKLAAMRIQAQDSSNSNSILNLQLEGLKLEVERLQQQLLRFNFTMAKEEERRHAAFALIVQSFDHQKEFTDLFREKLNEECPRTLWQAVRTQFSTRLDNELLAPLTVEIASMKMKPGEELDAFVGRLTALNSRIGFIDRAHTAWALTVYLQEGIGDPNVSDILITARRPFEQSLRSNDPREASQAFTAFVNEFAQVYSQTNFAKRQAKLRQTQPTPHQLEVANHLNERHDRSHKRPAKLGKPRNVNTAQKRNEDLPAALPATQFYQSWRGDKRKFCTFCRITPPTHSTFDCKVKLESPCKLCGSTQHVGTDCKNCWNCFKPNHRHRDCRRPIRVGLDKPTSH